MLSSIVDSLHVYRILHGAEGGSSSLRASPDAKPGWPGTALLVPSLTHKDYRNPALKRDNPPDLFCRRHVLELKPTFRTAAAGHEGESPVRLN